MEDRLIGIQLHRIIIITQVRVLVCVVPFADHSADTFLPYNDLDIAPVGVGVPQLHANLSKNGSIPDLSGGTLCADSVNKRFLYGGEFTGISPNTPNLWSYDILYNQ